MDGANTLHKIILPLSGTESFVVLRDLKFKGEKKALQFGHVNINSGI